jgi:hypothetical protein
MHGGMTLNPVETLSQVEETLFSLVKELADDRQMDAASDAQDIAVLVRQLKRKVEK